MAERADNEITALWGDRLAAVPAHRIPPGADPATARFLTTVGLPTIRVQGIEFVHDERISRTVEHFGRHYLQCAEIDGTPIGIDLAGGQVAALIGGRRARTMFVNSGLLQFLLALGAWNRDVWEPTVVGMRAEDGFRAYDHFEATQRERDPAAFGNGCYWPELLEGLREGAER